MGQIGVSGQGVCHCSTICGLEKGILRPQAEGLHAEAIGCQ